jgi:hypothetical protein
MSQSDYRNAILLCHFFGSLAASVRSDSVLPSSNIDSSFTRHGLRPRNVGYALTVNVHTNIGFQEMKPLAQCNKEYFGDQHLHAFALWLTNTFPEASPNSLPPYTLGSIIRISFSAGALHGRVVALVVRSNHLEGSIKGNLGGVKDGREVRKAGRTGESGRLRRPRGHCPDAPLPVGQATITEHTRPGDRERTRLEDRSSKEARGKRHEAAGGARRRMSASGGR